MMKTKHGEFIDFTFHAYYPDGINEPWVVHVVSAKVNGEEAGYLKISYVPSEKLKAQMPSVIHYMGMVRGWCGIEEALKNGDKVALLRRIAGHLPDLGVLNDSDLPNKDEDWLNSRLEEYKGRLTRKFGAEFDTFIAHHVDKPKVDFIRVYRKGERAKNFSNDEMSQRTSKDFRRQGIGTALYKAGTIWMAAGGLRLYASTLQSDEAQAIWKALSETDGLKVIKEGSRMKDHNGKSLKRQYLVTKENYLKSA